MFIVFKKIPTTQLTLLSSSSWAMIVDISQSEESITVQLAGHVKSKYSEILVK